MMRLVKLPSYLDLRNIFCVWLHIELNEERAGILFKIMGVRSQEQAL